MNNEPVAYMSVYIDDEGDKSTMFCTHKDQYIDNQTPLYTHPAKTLTGEEITEIFDTTFEVRDFEDSFIKFARAILKKASEK